MTARTVVSVVAVLWLMAVFIAVGRGLSDMLAPF